MQESTIITNQPSPLGISEEVARAVLTAFEEGEYQKAKALLLGLHPVDIAHFLSMCRKEQRPDFVALLDAAFSADILLAIDRAVAPQIIDILGFERVAALMSGMDIVDAVYVVEDLPGDSRQELLSHIANPLQQQIIERLNYPENSAGRLMHRRMISVMEYWTVGQTIDYIRANRDLPQDFYQIFVLNHTFQPVGAVQVSRLLCSPRSSVITEIMNDVFTTIPVDCDQEEVSYLFTQYELTSAPVVNKEGRLLGVVSVDDIVEIIEEEAEEDIMRMGGITATDIHAPVLWTAFHRLPWLLTNLVIAVATCSVIRLFESTIGQMVVLASLMPMVASLGGNAGTQTMTVAVRSIATRELTSLNAWRVIGKELGAGLINGFCCGLVGGLIVGLVLQQTGLSMVFGIAIMVNVLIASIVGTGVPLLLSRLGADPAVASGVFLTALTDIIGFFIFLMLATLVLL
jgi:magnesium transporter